jgi:hypothetical protein
MNLIIPFFVSIVFWFISYAYFSLDKDENINIIQNPQIGGNIQTNLSNNIDVIAKKNLSDTSEPHSFNLVSNGVQIPTNLPDILFEMN